MIAELDVYGVFISPLLVYTLLAMALTGLLRRALQAADFYRFVWHRALFDFALLVIVLGAVVFVASLVWAA